MSDVIGNDSRAHDILQLLANGSAMSMIKDQERNVEKLITESLDEKNLEVAAMRVDSLLFTDYVTKNSPQNIEEAVRLHLKIRYEEKLSQPNDKIDMDGIRDSIHRDIESGRFNMRFFYPDTKDTVKFDEKIQAYSRELKEQGVLMPGMNAQDSHGLTLVAYFAQHIVGDMQDYDEICKNVHRNITASIPKMHKKESVTPADILRIDDEEKKGDPLALLSNSHLVKRLSDRQFVFNRDIEHAAEEVRLEKKLNNDELSP